MKCSVCNGPLAWGEGVSQRGQGVRHEVCVPEKKKKTSSQGSSQGAKKIDKVLTAVESVAVRIEVKGEPGSSWYGRDREEALAHARASMARKYGKDFHTFVEMEGEEHE